MRIAICDDDKVIVDHLHGKVQNIMSKWAINVQIYDFTDAGDMLYEIESTGIFDIIFLDVEIGDYNGIDIAKQLKNKYLVFTLIFISQYDKYYRSAFEVQPFWFLDKPFLDDKLEYKRETYDFSFNKIYYKITIDKIMYFESTGRIITIHCIDGDIYQCYSRLSKIEEEMTRRNRTFMRIHQSYYVNQIYIKKYMYDSIMLSNGETLYISLSKRDEIRKKYIEIALEKNTD
jgi:DNA-binding LytR/AlgR family response regulator